MTRQNRQNSKARLLRKILRSLFELHHQTKTMNLWGLVGQYADRREQYRKVIRELYKQKGAPLAKEEVEPYKEAFKINDIYDKHPNENLWHTPLCEVFNTFYDAAEGISGQEARKQITEKDIPQLTTHNPHYIDYSLAAHELLRKTNKPFSEQQIDATLKKIILKTSERN